MNSSNQNNSSENNPNPHKKRKGRKWQKSRTRRTDIQVAWVQQRIGHFEKVTELCTLCGAKSVVVFFSS
ncbi:hypothetical protein ABFS82_08G206300 [Erythranthe guttata]